MQFLAFRPLSAASAPAATTEEDGQGPVADGGGGSGHHRGPASRLALLALALGSSAASALGVVGLYHLFKHSPAWLANAVGSGVCSVLLAVGFLPQLALMCRERSSAGFSLGLSALDLTGSALSIAVLAMAPLAESGAPVDVGGIVPYAVIVGFQLVVVFLALFVYPDPGRFAHCAQWSRERSMKGVVFGGSMKQGGDGRGEQEELAKAAADDAAPTAVEEGKKGTGEGEGERA